MQNYIDLKSIIIYKFIFILLTLSNLSYSLEHNPTFEKVFKKYSKGTELIPANFILQQFDLEKFKEIVTKSYNYIAILPEHLKSKFLLFLNFLENYCKKKEIIPISTSAVSNTPTSSLITDSSKYNKDQQLLNSINKFISTGMDLTYKGSVYAYKKPKKALVIFISALITYHIAKRLIPKIGNAIADKICDGIFGTFSAITSLPGKLLGSASKALKSKKDEEEPKNNKKNNENQDKRVVWEFDERGNVVRGYLS